MQFVSPPRGQVQSLPVHVFTQVGPLQVCLHLPPAHVKLQTAPAVQDCLQPPPAQVPVQVPAAQFCQHDPVEQESSQLMP